MFYIKCKKAKALCLNKTKTKQKKSFPLPFAAIKTSFECCGAYLTFYHPDQGSVTERERDYE